MSEWDELTTLVRTARPLLVMQTVDEQRVSKGKRCGLGREGAAWWRIERAQTTLRNAGAVLTRRPVSA
ncbi:MAG: hypothetical protein ABI227_11590 [Rhodanobacter sp.]